MANRCIIEPTIESCQKSQRVIEAYIPAASLSDISDKYEISANLLVSILNRYFSAEEVGEIEKYVAQELDVEVLEEGVDTSVDSLIDKIPDTELKNMVKDAGMTLSGRESKDELTGMVKALSKDESLSSKSEAGFAPEYIGGYKIDLYLKLAEAVDVDKLADDVTKCLNSCNESEYLKRAQVADVSISQLPKNLFESKKLSKFVK